MVRSRTLAALGVALLSGVAAVPGPMVLAADSPVTLRFAISDSEGRPSDPYVRAFIAEVAERSGGSVTVDPLWDAGIGTAAGFEQGVAHLLADGSVDLALVAGRAWDDVGVTSLQALQAPFLIDDDALAVAVATSPVAADMLAGMATVGIIGLSMWPEDLRHPAVFQSCIEPLVDPVQLEGVTVRVVASTVTFGIIRALGAEPVFVDGYGPMVDRCEIQAAESGLRQGASLPSPATFTGDVTFFPKYQVLAAGAGILSRLSDAQQTAIRDAASAVRDVALAEHPTDADAAATWCAGGGHVVLAGPDGVTAFEMAVQPVFDRMAQDPLTAAAISAIRALKETIEPAAGAAACGTGADGTAADEWPVSDLAGTSALLPPSGSYRTTATQEDLIARGATSRFASMNAGTVTLIFDGSALTLIERDGGPCTGTMSSVNAASVEVVTDPNQPCGLDFGFVWRPEGDGIALVLMPPRDPSSPMQDFLDFQAFIERVWIQID